jgi:hypothetical protein
MPHDGGARRQQVCAHAAALSAPRGPARGYLPRAGLLASASDGRDFPMTITFALYISLVRMTVTKNSVFTGAPRAARCRLRTCSTAQLRHCATH